MAEENSKRMRLSHATILDLPNEILLKILKNAKSDKNLSLTCLRFNELINKINEKHVSLVIDHRCLINPMFDLDNHIKSSNISLKIEDFYNSLSNIDDKIELFLRDHGHRVTKLTYSLKSKPITTKLLQMLPNLDELELTGSHSIDYSELKGFSKSLRKLTCKSASSRGILNVFTFDELIVSERLVITSRKLLPKHKNLKKLTLYNCKLTKSLNKLELESFVCHLRPRNIRNIGNFLRSQMKLKELSLAYVDKEIWAIVCECSEKLELLDVLFATELKAAEFRKISSLKSLKTLRFPHESNRFNKVCFDELKKIKFGHLVSLELFIKFELSASDIENLSVNFKNIKSLALEFSNGALQVVSKVFEKFNRLESLILRAFIYAKNQEDVSAFFSAQNHHNPHLKSLHFKPHLGNLDGSLILKFTRDFPNLESIELSEKFEPTEHFASLMAGFKKLKRIKNLVIHNEELFATFLQHRQDLEEVSIDTHIMENPNEVLKGFSISFNMRWFPCKMTRNSEQGNEVDFLTFSRCQQLRTMMDSTRQIKHLAIYFPSSFPEIATRNFIKYLTVIGESVTTLTLQGIESCSVLKAILNTVPNVETLNLENSYFLQVCSCNFSEKLTFVNLLNCAGYCYDDNAIRRFFETLHGVFKFKDNSLLSFSSTDYSKSAQHRDMMIQGFEKFLVNQRKLTQRSETFIDEGKCTIRFTADCSKP